MAKVYFIGAGPGDIELLTIKASKIIKIADIVIYAGSLVNKNILKLAKKSAYIYDSSGMTLDAILDIIRKEKATAQIIARIHSGDPSLYGAIQEQMDWCEKQKIDYEVIPGISSYQAAAACLKQEFTLPGVSQTVILTRISGRTQVPAKEDLSVLAKSKSTMAIFLSISMIDKVVEKLTKSYPVDTAVVVIERVSYPDERIIKGTLKNIAKKLKEAKYKPQPLIIVGDVLIKKYRKSKLYAQDFEHGFRHNI